jgi:hypothetical protein
MDIDSTQASQLIDGQGRGLSANSIKQLNP